MLLRFPFIDRVNPFICSADGDEPPKPGEGDGGDKGAGGGGDPPKAGGAAGAEPTDEEKAAAAAAPAAAAPKAGEPAQDGWKDKQIDRQHRKIKQLEAQAGKEAELAAENQRLKDLLEARSRDPAKPGEGAPAEKPPAPVAKPAETVRQPVGPADPVAQARFQIEVEQVTKQLNSAEYAKEWEVGVRNFQTLGGVDPAVMTRILATDDPAYVLVQLGKDPEKYQEILDLPDAKQQNALTKISLEKSAKPPAPKPKPSNAPEPPAHIGGGGGGGDGGGAPGGIIPDQDDRVPMPAPGVPAQNKYGSSEYDEAWYAARREQKRNSQGRPWSIGGKAGPGAGANR
jgi:hypothetical protein